MSSLELSVLITVLVVLGVVVLAVSFLASRLKKLNDSTEELRQMLNSQLLPAAERLELVSLQMKNEINRTDGLLEVAEEVSKRADALSQVTYEAVAKPVVKTLAALKGAGSAVRNLSGNKSTNSNKKGKGNK